MESSYQAINPSNPSTRLERFKQVCLEKRTLREHIEKLIVKREALAVRELEHAESEFERIKANAEDVRAQLEETRRAEMGSTMKSEEAMVHTLNGPLDAALLSKTADLEGDGPSLLATSVVKGSTRNSTSYKSAESPILPPSDDEGSIAGSPYRPSFTPDPRSEDYDPTIAIAEEDGQGCEKLLEAKAQRYAELCDVRRALEMEIEGGLVEEEKIASKQVESARSSLRLVRETILEIRDGLKRADEKDTVINIPPTVSTDGLHRGEGLEDTLSPATTIHPDPSEARVNRSPSVSNASTHDNPQPSIHAPESSRGSHFPRAAAVSSAETHATGSHVASVHKTRKRLTKRGYKQIERYRVGAQEDATPLV